MSAYARSPLARPSDMSDDDYGVPFQMPGNSTSFFDLDSDVGLGFPTRRADNIKVQTILGNAGDLDLAKTDGPTGWGLYTLDDAIRGYQKRNDLKVDGWLRPGGPTISKMRDQFGATLGKYPAPSPREVDEHHDRLAQGEPGLLNGTYGELKLAPIPGLPAPDADMTGSNRSMAEYLQRHRSGLADAPATLAAYVRNQGVPGIVQARDFVGQWDAVKPGQGGDAIRAILSALGDAPDLQRQFFGGPIANNQPIGIRIGDMRGEISDLVHRPGEEGPAVRQPYAPLPPLSRDGLLDPEYIKAFSERLDAKRAFEEQERANAVYDDGLLDANNWPPHLRARLLGDAPANDETSQNFSGTDEFQPVNVPEPTDEEFTGQDDDPDTIQIAEANGRKSQRQPAQPAARPGQPATPPAAAAPKPDGSPSRAKNPNGHPNNYFDLLDKRVTELAERLETNRDLLHSLFAFESGWMNEETRARNNPFGYKRTHKDKTQSHIEFESLDDAFRVWENMWGDRVRGAKTPKEFVYKLQNPPPGAKNQFKYNTAESSSNPQSKRDYEKDIADQYRTILRRREQWVRDRSDHG